MHNEEQSKLISRMDIIQKFFMRKIGPKWEKIIGQFYENNA